MNVEAEQVRAGIRRAFTALRAQGYVAKANYLCCSSCAVRDLKAKDGLDTAQADARYIFYTAQGHELLSKAGQVYLQWGGDAAEIIKSLRDAGLEVSWEGTNVDCIHVTGVTHGGESHAS